MLLCFFLTFKTMKLLALIILIILISRWKETSGCSKFLVIIICFALISRHNNPKCEPQTFFFDSPAKEWEETLPLGNGRLGIMPDGGVETETIVLNDITLWSGSHEDYSNPKALESLPEIQKLLLEGKNYEAQQLMYETFTCGNKGSNHGNAANSTYGCFQTLGNIKINYHYPEGTVFNEKYRRNLDLNEAVAYTIIGSDKANYRREYFVSRDSDVAVIHIKSDKRKTLSFDVRFERPERVKYHTEDDAIVMSGQLNDGHDGDDGMRYLSKITVKNDGGLVKYVDNQIIVENANEATLIFSSATDYNDADYENTVQRLMENAKKESYNKLKKKHIQSYQNLFNRVDLKLGEPVTKDLPINQRLAKFQEDNDPSMAALYFQYGRYLLISSTREDLLPPNLQGLWANSIQTPWNGDYHLNINVQMNHWPVEKCNLSELHLPLVKLTKELADHGAKTAQDFYNAEGWTAHVITNLWGFTEPGEHPSWGATNTGGAWLCQHLYQHYLFTQDIDYLREIYPIMKGSALFFKSIMIEEPQHGWLVTAPTSSPENAFYQKDGRIASVCMGSTMDIQIISELFDNVIDASKILDTDHDFADTLALMMKHFPPYQVNGEGLLQEWLEDYKETEPTHRHVSHLYGLYPGNQITRTKTADLCDACAKVLERRGDGGTGWSRAWKIAFWARLGNGERSYALLKNLLHPALVDGRHGSGTYPNMFCAHPPFQIDGNFGGTAGIAEMLLQSHDGFIEVLPAIPSCWHTGFYRGLCAENGAVVDCRWKDGKVTKVKIYSKTGGSYKLKIPNADGNKYKEFTLRKGGVFSY